MVEQCGGRDQWLCLQRFFRGGETVEEARVREISACSRCAHVVLLVEMPTPLDSKEMPREREARTPHRCGILQPRSRVAMLVRDIQAENHPEETRDKGMGVL